MEFSAICRTCLGTVGLNPIFNATVDPTRYSTAIFISTGLKVKLNDGMPQQMCSQCIDNLNNSLKFRKLSRDSEAKLLQFRNQFHDKDIKYTPNKVKHQNYKEFEKERNENFIIDSKWQCEPILKEVDAENIKLENDSDLENDTPLSCLTENIKKNDRSDKQTENSKETKKVVQRVSCPICHKELSARSLSSHVSARHGDADGRARCELCAARVQDLSRHVRVVHGEGGRCGYCKVDYGSKEALVTHARNCAFKKRRRGSESGKESVSCEVCHKVMQRASLRAHVAVKHAGLGPVCEHCGRRFGNKLRLSEHLRAKHGYEKLRCARCEFSTASNAALQNHERRHRGEKPFVCESCGAKFHAAYLLAQHRHSHRTDRRVKCTLCGATFKSSNSLHAHRLARHGARAHRCLLCARSYSCRHYAVKHLRTVHGFKGTVPPLQVDPAPET